MLASIVGALPSAAFAQDGDQVSAPAQVEAEPDGAIADIVVTAEKRTGSLQRTPIAITALSGAELRSSNSRSLDDIQGIVPGLKVGAISGQSQVSVRGIGTSSIVPGAEGAVAVNVNEVYISRQSALSSSMYDLASLEVLRGPQGTLYGRNATAGSINLTTARPGDVWSGFVQGTVGNFSAINIEAAVGGPIVEDRVGIRIAGFVDRHDGYGTNLVTGSDIDDRDAKGARITLVLSPTDSLKATIIGDYYHQRDRGAARHYFGADSDIALPGVFPGRPVGQRDGGYFASRLRDIAAGYDPQLRLETKSITGIVEWTSGPFGLKSITNYRDQEFNLFTSLDGGSNFAGFYVAGEPAHQVSEELQAHYDGGRINATAGLYYFHEKVSASPSRAPELSDVFYPALGLPAPSPSFYVDAVEIGGTIKTTAKAIFGQIDYEVIDRLTLTFGLRYGSESKQLFSTSAFDPTKVYDFDPANPFFSTTPPGPLTVLPKRTFNSTTPKFGIRFQATPRLMFYASYSEGFRSGGYDITSVAPAYQPEHLAAYEGGMKATAFDNRVRANLSGFYYDYTNLQVQQVAGVQVITQNAGAARLYGGEAQVTIKPVETLTIDMSGTYLHARYQDYQGASSVQPFFPGNVDFGGKRLNNAPTFAGLLSVEKAWPLGGGTLSVKAEGEYSSKFYFTPDNVDPLSQDAFFKSNLYLRFASTKGWTATAFVKNVGDKVTKTAANVTSPIFGAAVEGSVTAPRTYGITLGYSF
ncbi:TonB-dependent receptor [Sphingomonas cavernae]|nr:TonB-dependent receptor [Sphingomonas cavernae]